MTDDNERLVTTEKRGAVGIVSFDEPEALNPLSTYPGGSEEQLADGIVAFDRDPDVKVIVVTGTGRAFSAGADARPARTAAATTASPADVAVLRALSASPEVDEGGAWSMWYVLERCTKPLIAAVHGWCIAGGWEVALWCDMIVADETARFALAEINLGLFPAHATTFIARTAGRWRAAELSYTGRTIDVHEADELGLVTKLVPAGTDVDEAVALGNEIARFPLPALAAIRRVLNRATITTSEWEQNRRDFVLVGLSDSAKEWGARWRSDMQAKRPSPSGHSDR
ncbi:MAG TPA: enoyl-CoA hydratase/isomerase family protein [Acidimicrobiales bacterium]|nr:enoyl-CoA hydratase/isomerase family protein [Acidimicrobiales bacterium]